MRLSDKLLISLHGAFSSGLPTALCLLATTVSIFTAGTILHVSKAATSFVSQQLSAIGISGVTLYTKEPIQDLTAAIAQISDMQEITEVMPLAMTTGTLRDRESQRSALFMGVGADVTRLYRLTLLHGRSFTPEELAAGESVILVDDQLAEKLYQRTNILGKTVRLSSTKGFLSATVVGVFRSQKQDLESSFGVDIPEIIYLPIKALDDFAGAINTDKIAISCIADADQEQVAAKAAAALTRSTGQRFQYENISGYYTLITEVTDAVGLAILSIGLVAVLVGGLGLMIAMLSAVDRRRQVIGIYMALGAPGSVIVELFLLEGIELCLLGGIAGSGLSLAVMKLLQNMLPLEIQNNVIFAVVAAAGTGGVLFSMLPAIKASRMDPIQALTE